MKKEQAKGFVTGMLVMALAIGMIGTAAATVGQRTANLDYKDIKIRINGQPVTPIDANGNAIEPFSIDGTIYLPVRAVGNAMGYDVSWDGATNTATLLDDTFARPAKLYASIYLNNAVDVKEIGDTVRLMQTRCQEMLFTESANGVLAKSKILEMCTNHATAIQSYEAMVNDYERKLRAVCDTDEEKDKMMTLYKGIISDLTKANNGIKNDNQTFSTHYSAALKKCGELIMLCDDTFAARVADAQDALDRVEIAPEDATTVKTEDKAGNTSSGGGTSGGSSTGGTSSGGGSGESEAESNRKLYEAERAALDAEYLPLIESSRQFYDTAAENYNDAVKRMLPASIVQSLYDTMTSFKDTLDVRQSMYNDKLAALQSKYGI